MRLLFRPWLHSLFRGNSTHKETLLTRDNTRSTGSSEGSVGAGGSFTSEISVVQNTKTSLKELALTNLFRILAIICAWKPMATASVITEALFELSSSEIPEEYWPAFYVLFFYVSYTNIAFYIQKSDKFFHDYFNNSDFRQLCRELSYCDRFFSILYAISQAFFVFIFKSRLGLFRAQVSKYSAAFALFCLGMIIGIVFSLENKCKKQASQSDHRPLVNAKKQDEIINQLLLIAAPLRLKVDEINQESKIISALYALLEKYTIDKNSLSQEQVLTVILNLYQRLYSAYSTNENEVSTIQPLSYSFDMPIQFESKCITLISLFLQYVIAPLSFVVGGALALGKTVQLARQSEKDLHTMMFEDWWLLQVSYFIFGCLCSKIGFLLFTQTIKNMITKLTLAIISVRVSPNEPKSCNLREVSFKQLLSHQFLCFNGTTSSAGLMLAVNFFIGWWLADFASITGKTIYPFNNGHDKEKTGVDIAIFIVNLCLAFIGAFIPNLLLKKKATNEAVEVSSSIIKKTLPKCCTTTFDDKIDALAKIKKEIMALSQEALQSTISRHTSQPAEVGGMPIPEGERGVEGEGGRNNDDSTHFKIGDHELNCDVTVKSPSLTPRWAKNHPAKILELKRLMRKLVAGDETAPHNQIAGNMRNTDDNPLELFTQLDTKIAIETIRRLLRDPAHSAEPSTHHEPLIDKFKRLMAEEVLTIAADGHTERAVSTASMAGEGTSQSPLRLAEEGHSFLPLCANEPGAGQISAENLSESLLPRPTSAPTLYNRSYVEGNVGPGVDDNHAQPLKCSVHGKSTSRVGWVVQSRSVPELGKMDGVRIDKSNLPSVASNEAALLLPVGSIVAEPKPEPEQERLPHSEAWLARPSSAIPADDDEELATQIGKPPQFKVPSPLNLTNFRRISSTNLTSLGDNTPGSPGSEPRGERPASTMPGSTGRGTPGDSSRPPSTPGDFSRPPSTTGRDTPGSAGSTSGLGYKSDTSGSTGDFFKPGSGNDDSRKAQKSWGYATSFSSLSSLARLSPTREAGTPQALSPIQGASADLLPQRTHTPTPVNSKSSSRCASPELRRGHADDKLSEARTTETSIVPSPKKANLRDKVSSEPITLPRGRTETETETATEGHHP